MEKMRGKKLALDLFGRCGGRLCTGRRTPLLYQQHRYRAGRSQRYGDPVKPSDESPDRYPDISDQYPLLIASWIYLGKEKTIKTLKTVVIMTVILDGLVTPYFPVYSGDKMVSCLFGGVLIGISLAVIFMRGSTTGGGDIAAKLLQKYVRTCRPEKRSWRRTL